MIKLHWLSPAIFVFLGILITAMSNSTFDPSNENQFEKSKLLLDIKGVIGTITHGTTGNVDLDITDDELITGATVNVQNSAFGDYMDIQVIVPPSTVANQFVTSFYVNSDAQKQIDFTNKYPAKIPAGLKLRLVYHSTGAVLDPKAAVNYVLHKVLL